MHVCCSSSIARHAKDLAKRGMTFDVGSKGKHIDEAADDVAQLRVRTSLDGDADDDIVEPGVAL